MIDKLKIMNKLLNQIKKKNKSNKFFIVYSTSKSIFLCIFLS